MTRKLIDAYVEEGRMFLETRTSCDTEETFVVMYSKGKLSIISETDGTHNTNIYLDGGNNALDMSIAEIFPRLDIISGRIPRYQIEAFRNDNMDLLIADGYEGKSVSNASGNEKLNPDVLTAGIGIGAVITAVIAVLISKRK